MEHFRTVLARLQRFVVILVTKKSIIVKRHLLRNMTTYYENTGIDLWDRDLLVARLWRMIVL